MNEEEKFRKQWEPSLTQALRDHPKGTELVEKMIKGELPVEEINKAFDESPKFERFAELNQPDSDGYVTFERYNGNLHQ